jgi:hypothetical protein
LLVERSLREFYDDRLELGPKTNAPGVRFELTT